MVEDKLQVMTVGVDGESNFTLKMVDQSKVCHLLLNEVYYFDCAYPASHVAENLLPKLTAETESNNIIITNTKGVVIWTYGLMSRTADGLWCVQKDWRCNSMCLEVWTMWVSFLFVCFICTCVQTF